MEFSLKEDQLAVVEAVKQVVRKYEPRREQLVKQIFHDKNYPQEVWDDLAAAGFIGSVLPESYGGSDLGLLPFTLGFEELAWAGLGSAMHVLTVMDS